MAERIIIVVLLVAMMSVKLNDIIPLSIFVLLGLLILIKRPYLDKINNIRAATNMGICIVVEGTYLWYRTATTEAQHKSSFAFYAPLIVCILLLLCVIYNSIVLVFYLVKTVKSKLN